MSVFYLSYTYVIELKASTRVPPGNRHMLLR